MKKLLQTLGVALMSVLPFLAHADTDFTPLTSGVSFVGITAAILAVAVLGVTYVIAKGGAAGIVSFIKRMAHG